MIPAKYESRLDAIEHRIRMLAATDELDDEALDDLEGARHVAFVLARAVQGNAGALAVGREIASVLGARGH